MHMLSGRFLCCTKSLLEKIVKSEKSIVKKGTTVSPGFVKIWLSPAINIAETAVNRKRVRA